MAAKIAVPKDPTVEAGGLRRELGLWGGASVIIGIVIGSGIFLGVNRVAAGTGSPWLIVLVWVVAGLLTLAGALTYAELGTMFPKAGGEYVFLREGVGSLAAFLSGWTAFTVNLAGSTAALAVIFAEQLDQLSPYAAGGMFGDWTMEVVAACLIGLLSIINYYGVKYGGGVQRIFTAIKVFLIVALAGAALLFLGEAASPEAGFFEQVEVEGTPSSGGFSLAGFLGLAMVGALFAYDGWTDLARVGGEVKDPDRNIPRASLIAMLGIMLMYILISLGYLNVLGFEGFAAGSQAGFDSDRTVATNAAEVLFGDTGVTLITLMILVSVFGALNGVIMVTPRVAYAMSVDRVFPRLLGKLNRHAAPHWGILANGAIAVLFLIFFDFESLSGNVVFISFFFYGLAAVSLMVLRRRHPGLHRPYKVTGYPIVPILFIATSWLFVGYLIYEQAVELATNGFLSANNMNRLLALLIVAGGLPIFFVLRAKWARECEAKGMPPPAPLFGPDPRAEEREAAIREELRQAR